MNKEEFVKAIAKDSGLSKKDTEKLLNSYEAVVTSELAQGGKVRLIGFGTYETADRKERMGKNPQTQKPVKIKARTVPRFKPGKRLADAVNNK